MGFEWMVVIVVSVGCAYELGKRIVDRVFVSRDDMLKGDDVKALTSEIQELRSEVKQLRQENHDLMLAIDDAGVVRRAHTTSVESGTPLTLGR